MCLNVLRCMGVSTVEKGDSDVEEITTGRRHAPVEEPARIYPSGNGAQHSYPPKSAAAAAGHSAAPHASERYPHCKADEEAAAAVAAKTATSDAVAEKPPAVEAKKEEPRNSVYAAAGGNKSEESPAADQTNPMIRRGYDEGLRGAAAPAKTPVVDGRDHAYGSNPRAATSESLVKAKEEESRSEHTAAGARNKTNHKDSPADHFNDAVVAGLPRRDYIYDEGLRGAAAPAADAATYPGQYTAAHGRDIAYGKSAYI